MQSKRRLVVLEMEEVNQLQKAGKDSQQIQIGNVIINSAGITEERARVNCPLCQGHFELV